MTNSTIYKKVHKKIKHLLKKAFSDVIGGVVYKIFPGPHLRSLIAVQPPHFKTALRSISGYLQNIWN